MKPQIEDQRAKAKLSLLQRLKGLKMKSQQKPPEPQDAKNYNMPIPSRIEMPEKAQKRTLFNKGKPQSSIFPEKDGEDDNQQQRQDIQNNLQSDESDNQQKGSNKKQINIDQNYEDLKRAQRQARAREQVRGINRVKKPYYEHYSKEGVYEPCLPHVQAHENPSGKPPDIPEQLTKDIQVVPKRPWVYFGPENVPPTDCEQITANNFSKIFQQAKKQKRHHSGILKKSSLRNKKNRKNQEDFSEISDDFTSNFNISDSVDLSKDSDLISDFRSQSRRDRDNSMKMEEEDQGDYSEYSMSGSLTQKQKYNLFDSDEESEGMESNNIKKGKKSKRQKNQDKPSVFSDSISINRPESMVSSNSQEISIPKKRRNIQRSSSKMEQQSVSQSYSVSKRITRRSQNSLPESQSQLPPTRRKKVVKQHSVIKTRSKGKMSSEQEQQKSEGSQLKDKSPQQQMSERKKSLRKRKK